MNSTLFNNTITASDKDIMNYAAMAGWGMFIISELMPFLKKKEKFNGLLHTATCILRGSKCMVDNALTVAESAEGKESDTEGAAEDKV
tara:strand:+ start:10 stop:273 length:264 start_codon:yes stop_codon:yes gene_type:complete